MGKTIDTLKVAGDGIGNGFMLIAYLTVDGLGLLGNRIVSGAKRKYYDMSGINYRMIEDVDDDSFIYCVREFNL